MNYIIILVKIVIGLHLVVSCSSTKSGQYVRIGHPYNLEQISKAYKVPVSEIKNYNLGKSLSKGNWIFVPKPVGMMMSKRQPAGMSLENVDLIWPLQFTNIRVSSDYGYRGFSHHDGIDLPAPRKTPIVASASGRVITSSRVKGYGKTVIIDHGNGIQTLYAHNAENLVKKGSVVHQGQVIGLVGATGRATGNHLHFEIRIAGEHKDPLSYLPDNKNIAFQ
jgi:murein DD-endopeptidase MepM/ murein hydrolase activator NlpD